MQRGWKPGETVVLRYFKFGRVAGALPVRTLDGWTLELAPGTRVRWAAVGGRHVHDLTPHERLSSRDWGSVERDWAGEGVVIVGRPGRAHSIWHFWDGEAFAGWYVNLEAPWKRSRLGFDTEDHELDVWVEPDGSCRWKDEDHLETAIEVGAYSRDFADEVRAEGERVLDEWPFPTGWEERRPARSSPPALPRAGTSPSSRRALPTQLGGAAVSRRARGRELRRSAGRRTRAVRASAHRASARSRAARCRSTGLDSW